MSTWYNDIKSFYDAGFYDKNTVAEFTAAGWITPGEYEQITGEPYTT